MPPTNVTFEELPLRLRSLLRRSRRPIVLKRGGRPGAVVLTPAEFLRLRNRQRVLESIARGLADIRAGRTVSHEELMREARKRYAPSR